MYESSTGSDPGQPSPYAAVQFARRAYDPAGLAAGNILRSHRGRHTLNRSEKQSKPPKSAAAPATTATRVLVQLRKSHTLGSDEEAFSAARRTVSSTFISLDSCNRASQHK